MDELFYNPHHWQQVSGANPLEVCHVGLLRHAQHCLYGVQLSLNL
jgi:hypothetical protein